MNPIIESINELRTSIIGKMRRNPWKKESIEDTDRTALFKPFKLKILTLVTDWKFLNAE